MGSLTFFKGEGSTNAMIMVGKLKDKPAIQSIEKFPKNQGAQVVGRTIAFEEYFEIGPLG